MNQYFPESKKAFNFESGFLLLFFLEGCWLPIKHFQEQQGPKSGEIFFL
jgi:hypothetical protein